MKTNNNITELVFIIDRSGSMHGLEKDTIGGFNAMIEKQKQLDGRCYVTTVLFADEVCTVTDRAELKDIQPMTERDYSVGGCTAMLDAIGATIKHISHIHKYARREDVPQNTVFVIITDGMENASRKFTGEEVKKLIEREKEKYGWDFIFLASNIDAALTAARYGIDRDCAVDFAPCSEGVAMQYACASEAVFSRRSTGSIGKDWRKEADLAFNKK